MFENCTVMILTESNEIKRLDIDGETQKSICEVFSEAENNLTKDKTKVRFDGCYKPEKDEILSISNFQMVDEIFDAVRDPIGVSSYDVVKEKMDIKAVFIGKRTQEIDRERYVIVFQRFRKDQYITTSKFNLFFDKNTFRREKNFGISISDNVDCIYDSGELQFSSFYFARQVFDLSEYYRTATDQEVTEFASCEQLEIEDVKSFQEMANASLRRKIAMINDSKVLEEHTPAEVKKYAKQVGIDLIIKNKKIVIPNDKEQVKVILSFLDEEAYRGPFSQNTYLANSKRRISNS